MLLNIATLITPVYSRSNIEQDSIYTWVKFGCNLLRLVGQFCVQFNSPAVYHLEVIYRFDLEAADLD